MRKHYLILWLLFLQFAITIANGQTMRLDLNVGLRTTFEFYSIKFPAAYSSATGGYSIATDFYFRIPNTRLSPFIEMLYQFHPIRTQSAQELQSPTLDMNGFQAATGISTFQPLGRAKIGVVGSIGYSWDRFQVEHPDLGSFSLSHNRISFAFGFSLYFPFLDFIDATLGYGLSFKRGPNMSGSVQRTNYHLEGPSVFQTVSLGISLPIGQKEDE